MIELYGAGYVAGMLGMERAALSNQLARNFDDLPVPVAAAQEARVRWGKPRYYWDDAGLKEWRKWYASREGRRADSMERKAQKLRERLALIESQIADS